MRVFEVSKQDLRQARFANAPLPPLANGAMRLQLDLFALTANNITYAAMGQGMLGYYDFFPASEGWGRPPVWGFAEVVESNAPDFKPGQRFYGYFPIATTLDVIPKKTATGFVDTTAHRAEKAAVYNHYTASATDPAYDPAHEPEQTLFRPLYGTGWWAADCIAQNKPATVIMSSASNKTALATVHQLRRIGSANVIGLTSDRNANYVLDLRLYHRVVAYDDVARLADVAEPATYVDFLGREDLTEAVHTSLGAKLTRSILIGATDWADKPGGVAPPRANLPGPRPEFFFVPAYATQRMKEAPNLGADMQRDLRNFYEASRAYVAAEHRAGEAAILESWKQLATGSVPPRKGLVLSL